MEIEYMVRVKLPGSGDFASCPSGDTEYDEAYSKAIHGAIPDGFEVAWKTRPTWPKDRDGLTWVKLYCTDRSMAAEYFANEAASLTKQLDRAMKLARNILAV